MNVVRESGSPGSKTTDTSVAAKVPTIEEQKAKAADTKKNYTPEKATSAVAQQRAVKPVSPTAPNNTSSAPGATQTPSEAEDAVQPIAASPDAGGYSSPSISRIGHVDIQPLRDTLQQIKDTAYEQAAGQINRGVQQSTNELIRNQQDAEAVYQNEQNQISADEAVALDNQVLYAEARGDKGGIGAAQYAAIQNTAATNRMTVNSARTKLATDTSRQIADLRAQGEFEKADQLLSITQSYLSQLMQLEQWGISTNLSIDEFNASLEQWEAEYELSVAQLMGSYQGSPTLSAQQFQFQQSQAEESKLSSIGSALISAGIQPTDAQLAAMGLTSDQAAQLLMQYQLANGGGGGGSNPTPKDDDGKPGSDLGDKMYVPVEDTPRKSIDDNKNKNSDLIRLLTNNTAEDIRNNGGSHTKKQQGHLDQLAAAGSITYDDIDNIMDAAYRAYYSSK